MYIKIERIAGKRGIIPCYINTSQFTNVNIYSPAEALTLSAEHNKESFKKIKTIFFKESTSRTPFGNSTTAIRSTTPIDWVTNAINKGIDAPLYNKFLLLPLVGKNLKVDSSLINMDQPLFFHEYIFTEEDRKNDEIERKQCKTFMGYEGHWLAVAISPDEIFDMLTEVKNNAS